MCFCCAGAGDVDVFGFALCHNGTHFPQLGHVTGASGAYWSWGWPKVAHWCLCYVGHVQVRFSTKPTTRVYLSSIRILPSTLWFVLLSMPNKYNMNVVHKDYVTNSHHIRSFVSDEIYVVIQNGLTVELSAENFAEQWHWWWLQNSWYVGTDLLLATTYPSGLDAWFYKGQLNVKWCLEQIHPHVVSGPNSLYQIQNRVQIISPSSPINMKSWIYYSEDQSNVITYDNCCDKLINTNHISLVDLYGSIVSCAYLQVKHSFMLFKA